MPPPARPPPARPAARAPPLPPARFSSRDQLTVDDERGWLQFDFYFEDDSDAAPPPPPPNDAIAEIDAALADAVTEACAPQPQPLPPVGIMAAGVDTSGLLDGLSDSGDEREEEASPSDEEASPPPPTDESAPPCGKLSKVPTAHLGGLCSERGQGGPHERWVPGKRYRSVLEQRSRGAAPGVTPSDPVSGAPRRHSLPPPHFLWGAHGRHVVCT
jgi:hypothetical protein